MRKMKVLYVHGYGGSANGSSSKIVERAFNKIIDTEVIAPQIPYMNPSEAVKIIEEYSKDVDLVFASSLGAFYSSQVPGVYKVLFNIALPENVLKISNNEELYKELVYQKERLDDILDNDFRYETFIILGTNDKICNSTEYVLDHYWKDRVKFCSAEHHLQDSDEDELVTLLKDILDEVNR